MATDLLDTVRAISERVVRALDNYAQAKDPHVLDNLLFLTERVCRLTLSVQLGPNDGVGREAASLLATAIAILQVRSCSLIPYM